MELLSRLLGGTERVKLMRFFLHHEEGIFSPSTLSEKTKIKEVVIKKELAFLASLGFIEKKKAKLFVTVGKGKKAVQKLKEVNGLMLNQDFPLNDALKNLLFDFQAIDKKELASRFKATGRIKLFLTAGIFIGDEKSRLDVLIVGESMKKPKAEKEFEILSAELGREVVFAVMDVEEYMYRLKMYDKFVRDVLDMPNEKVIDKIITL
jgi:predicted transcriptional regulator